MKLDSSATKYLLTLLIIVFVVGWIAFTVFQNPKGEDGFRNDLERAEQLSADSSYVDLNGEMVSLSDYKGKTLVINAWATWCPFCVEELPDLGLLGGEYKDQDVVVIAINRKENQDTVEAFLNHVGNPENIIFLLDQEDNFYKSIGGFSMPETVFYDEDGNISLHKRGFMEIEEMRTHVENALTDNK